MNLTRFFILVAIAIALGVASFSLGVVHLIKEVKSEVCK